MYKLSTGEFTNQELYEKYKDKKDFVLNRFKDLDSLTIGHIILREEISHNILQNLTLALTYGKELCDMSKKQASELYFALVFNYLYSNKEYPIKITNLSQCKLLFKLSDGNVREYINRFADFKTEPTYLVLHASHSNLFEEANLVWKIPIFFYKDKETGVKVVSLYHGANNFGFVKVGKADEYHKIPRLVYLRFLTKLPQNPKSTDEIRNAFDEVSSQPLKEVLSYCDYAPTDRIEKEKGMRLSYKDDRLFVRLLTNNICLDSERFMQIAYNNYYYKKENILPFIQKDVIIIYEKVG